MRVDWVDDELYSDQHFAALLDRLSTEQVTRCGGLGGASRSLAAAAAHRLAGPTILVAASVSDTESIRDDLRAILGVDVLYFPDYETLPWEDEPAHQGVVSDRVECLSGLLSADPGTLVIVPAAALVKKLPPPDSFPVMRICTGMHLSLDTLEGWLVSAGYSRESSVFEQARWSRRGGIIDAGTFGMDNPIRVEFSGDEICSIRVFDQRSQRSIREISEVTFLPAREVFLSPDHWNRAIERVPESHPLAEKLWTSNSFPGIEHHLPVFFDGELVTLFDYMPSIGTLILVEPERISLHLSETIDRRRENFPGEDAIPFGFEDIYAGSGEILERMETSNRTLSMELTPSSDVDFYYNTLPQESFVGHRTLMTDQFRRWINEGYRIAVACDSPAEMETFADLLPRDLTITLTVLSLSEGFRMPDPEGGGVIVLSERKLLSGRRRPERVRRFRGGEILSSYDDLEPGQYVVHSHYGIGLYKGLERVSTGDEVLDCLAICYAGEDRLLVPMSEIGEVSKFLSPGGTTPQLDRIGGTSWNSRISRARQKAREIAGRLSVIYAERRARKREPFGEPGHLMQALEQSFPYEETPDQAKAITSVSRDFLRDEPMDRLVCGDVGYGKTEVAIRAAYRASESGFQVAVLVPTTILAEQHYNTFRDRLAEFPVTIDVLSRFRTGAEQRETIARLAEGAVDIVIGTHRLVQKDVRFHRLGLLIIDEEHRFGVRQKEYIRELRNTVDTLLMTATPIPRTLHMALSGFRDISIIATPPRDRYPVQTEIIGWNWKIIRRAIRRELERDGQVFFVHNRIATIERVRERLERFLPDVRIVVGHGQMKPADLEHVMHSFIEGEFDILLSTSIIESGLDLPAVNTIFIDNAWQFGLAELYQLRGRVGRSHHRAYCYLMSVTAPSKLKPEARNRLETIRRYTELGSGWHIAMRDLEIRGAGQFLGASQHGHLESIGYSMFEELIRSEVRLLKREPGGLMLESVRIEVPGEAFIPASYIPDVIERVRLYRSVWRAGSEDEIDGWKEFIRDRFGELPDPVHNAAERARLHLLARKTGAEEAVASTGRVRIVFAPGVRTARSVNRIISASGSRGKVVEEKTGRVVITCPTVDGDVLRGRNMLTRLLRLFF